MSREGIEGSEVRKGRLRYLRGLREIALWDRSLDIVSDLSEADDGEFFGGGGERRVDQLVEAGGEAGLAAEPFHHVGPHGIERDQDDRPAVGCGTPAAGREEQQEEEAGSSQPGIG